jgi:hypothetical protein
MPGQAEPALICGYVGYVTDPDRIRLADPKLLVKQVLHHRQLVSGISSGLEFSLLPAPYAKLLPDTFDSANANLDPMRRQIVL